MPTWIRSGGSPRKLGVQRRRVRVAQVRRRVVLAHLAQARELEQRVIGAAGLSRGARALEIHPRRHADAGRRQRLLRVAQREQRREHEPAARGVTGERDLRGRHARAEQPAIRGGRVLDGRGERVLGREPVVDHERARLRGARDPRRQLAVRVERADHVAAAVQVEDHAVRAALGHAHPLRRDAPGVDTLVCHVGGEREHLRHLLEAGAALLDGRADDGGPGREHR